MSTTSYKPREGMAKVWLVLILGSLTAFGPLSMDMYLPALPEVAKDLQTTTSLVQASLTATLLGLGIGQLVFGPYSDIHGRRKPLTLTLIGYSIASFLSAFSPNIYVFIGLRFIQGFTGAAGIVIARASARDMYSGKDLTKFVALLSLVNGAAPILAPIFGGIVLEFTTWNGVFHVLGLIGVLMLIGVYFGLPETLPEEKRSESSVLAVIATFKGLLRDKVFMGVALTQGFIMASMFAYIAGSPFVLQNIYGVTPFQFSLFFALNGIGIIISAQVAGKLSSTVAESTILLRAVQVAFTASLFLLVVIWQQLPLWAMGTALFFIVSSVGAVSTTAFSIAMNRQGNAAGSASAFLGLVPFIGGAIVSPLVGIAGEASAVPMGMIIMTCTTSSLVLYYVTNVGKAV